MKRFGFLLLPTLVMVGMLGILFGVNPADAVVSNADYSGMPPFTSTVVTPNILVMMDNSGTMGLRAYCFSATGANVTNNVPPYTGASGGTFCDSNPAQYVDGIGAAVSSPLPNGAPFVETVTFGGLFDPLQCYTYDNAQNRFVPTVAVPSVKSAINTPAPAPIGTGICSIIFPSAVTTH